jgi:uncharacterized protein
MWVHENCYNDTMLRIPLRNHITELVLESLADSTCSDRLRAAAEFVNRADENGIAQMDPELLRVLSTANKVYETAQGVIRLRAEHVADLDEMRARVGRMVMAVEQCRCGPAPFDWANYHGLPDKGAPEPNESEINWVLCAASQLFNHALYFEVHEVIEPCWMRSRGNDKLFLKGLIQVAVGFHHHHNANSGGARTLLREGNDRLKSCRPVYRGMELNTFCLGVDDCVTEIGAPGKTPRPFSGIPRFELHGTTR